MKIWENILKNEKNREKIVKNREKKIVKNWEDLLKWKKIATFNFFFTPKSIFITYTLQFPARWPELVTHEYESHWQLQLL